MSKNFWYLMEKQLIFRSVFAKTENVLLLSIKYIHNVAICMCIHYHKVWLSGTCADKTSTINMIRRTEGEQVIISSHSVLIMALTYNAIIKGSRGWLA